MSRRASALVLELRPERISVVTGWRWGSDSTSVQTLERRDVSKSRMESCRALMKPPLLQFIAWVTSNLELQTQKDRRLLRCLLYLRAIASLNSDLLKTKPCFSSGRAFNQLEAPCSRAWRRFRCTSSGTDWSINSDFCLRVSRFLIEGFFFHFVDLFCVW